MKLKFILGAVFALAFAGALVHFYGGSRVPAGQPPIQSLTPRNVAAIKNEFNAARDDVRVLVLLSPT